MAQLRRKTQFNDQQRAEIFRRGRGVCAFCGKNLWILDLGISPFSDQDWADHIRPVTRKGDSSVANGICACSTCNSKKSNNSRDKSYILTANGRPSYYYYLWTRPQFDEALADCLSRHSELELKDWFLNRAFSNAFWHMSNLWEAVNRKRRKKHWYGASWKLLMKWKRELGDIEPAKAVHDLKRRGLIPLRARSDIKHMIAVCTASTKTECFRALDQLCQFYRDSRTAWFRFANALSLRQKRSVLASTMRKRHISQSTRFAMRQYLKVYSKHPDLLPSRKDEDSLYVE